MTLGWLPCVAVCRPSTAAAVSTQQSTCGCQPHLWEVRLLLLLYEQTGDVSVEQPEQQLNAVHSNVLFIGLSSPIKADEHDS